MKQAEQPFISWVMPAYNVESYIRTAIDSILAQTVDIPFELIIVNDCSNDSTGDIAEEYAAQDSRIRVIHRTTRSGSAFQARKEAILDSMGVYIAPLDADDFVSPDYLHILLKDIISKDEYRDTDLSSFLDSSFNNLPDIIYPLMYNGNSPLADYSELLGKSFQGSDCVVFTLDGWKINCNGGLLNRDLYIKAFEKVPTGNSEKGSSIYEDEVLTRVLLKNADKVLFSTARYYYRVNPCSVTHLKTSRSQEYLYADTLLIKFIIKEYGIDSDEYILVNKQAFHHYFDALRFINNYNLNREEVRKVIIMAKELKQNVDKSIIRDWVSPRYFSLFILPTTFSRVLVKVIDKLKK